jgi:tRNA threonylcarbamoyladenosine biosynthesis protein TsaB
VSSLAALALDATSSDDEIVVPVLDARRREVFAGFYRTGGNTPPQELAPPRVLAPAALRGALDELRRSHRLPPGAVRLVGDGVALYRADCAPLGHLGAGRTTPSAGSVGRIALASGPASNLLEVGPAYVRPSGAEIEFPQGNPGGTFAARPAE